MAVISAKIIGLKQIEQALRDAFEDWTRDDINDRLWEKEFKRADWEYDGMTTRENPAAFIKEAGMLRDIYDYGNLMQSGIESYKYEFSTNGASANWHWDAKNRSGREYAYYVHEGEYTNQTARPFTDRVSDAKFSFMSDIGLSLLDRVQAKLTALNAN
jgi:hypothetical protein